jgi:hypothetical protein
MLGISATAACNPLGMRAFGYNLDLHNDKHDLLGSSAVGYAQLKYRARPNFYRWAAQYGCRRDVRFHGFKWMAGREQQLSVMAQIRDSFLSERGVRVTTAEIPGFPKCDITAELYDLDENGTIDRLYDEMADAIAELDERTADEVSAEHPLTKILRARQRIELLKVPIAVELARDYIDKGFSIGIFVNFVQTMRELQARLKTDCIIDGSPSGIRHRQRNIDRFNSHESRLILINSEAGGVAVSLPDRTGQHPRVGLVFPGFSASTFRQVTGRFPREDSKSNCSYRVVLAAKTVEEKIKRTLDQKLANLDCLNDADFIPQA